MVRGLPPADTMRVRERGLVKKSYSVVALLFAFMTTVGCGGGGGGGSGGGSGGTATVTGALSGASTAAVTRTQRSWLAWAGEELFGLAREAYAAANGALGGVNVSVTGPGGSSSTDTDENGRFTVENAPTGDVVVSFQRGDCDAFVPLNDVSDGAVVRMNSVTFDCGRATVADLTETFQGVIDNKPASPNGNLNVCAEADDGNHVRAVKTGHAQFEGTSFADLQEGDLIEVSGQRAGVGANSAVDASTIQLVRSGPVEGSCGHVGGTQKPTPEPEAASQNRPTHPSNGPKG